MHYFSIALAIAPVFLLILLGYGLRRRVIQDQNFWRLNDKLAYWVLFPAFLFAKTSVITLTGKELLLDAIVIYSGFAGAIIFALVVSKLFRFNGQSASSVLQGAARHNTFIALVVADRLFGASGLSQAALLAALLIPMTNLVIVTLVVVLIKGKKEEAVFQSVLRDLVRNPLLIAVVLGGALNMLNITPIPVVNDLAEILGRAALPIMLIGVGANIQFRNLKSVNSYMVVASIGKMIVFPGIIFFTARAVGLADLAMMVAIIYGAVPTAASSYTLARQLGGNADLMSEIITVETMLSFLTLPLTIALAHYLVG